MPAPEGLRVYASFWASGQATSAGLNPFVRYPMTWIVEIPGPDVVDVNLNPPALLPVMQFVALFPAVPGAVSAALLSLAAYVSGSLFLIRKADLGHQEAAWLALFAAASNTLALGQLYVLLFVLGLGIWTGLRDGRSDLAGVLAGVLIAIKPNFALLLPIVFLARHYRLSLIAGVTAGAVSLAAAAIYGVDIYQQWLVAVRDDDHSFFPTTISIASYFKRLGYSGLVPALALGLLSFWRAYTTRPDAERAVAFGLIVSMLCAPLCWFHYLLALAPFIVSRRPPAVLWAATIFVLPPFLPLLTLREGMALQATVGGIYTLGALLIFAEFAEVKIPLRRMAAT